MFLPRGTAVLQLVSPGEDAPAISGAIVWCRLDGESVEDALARYHASQPGYYGLRAPAFSDIAIP